MLRPFLLLDQGGAAMLTASATDVLADIPAGQVRLAISANIEDTLGRLSTLTATELNGGRLVAVVWNQLPLQPVILEEAIDKLAEAALTYWPAWYLADQTFDPNRPSIEILNKRLNAAELEGHISRHWLKLADKSCQTQRLPRWSSEFTKQLEAHQLALALGGRGCRIVLAATVEEQDDLSLQGLARAAEWLARKTSMPLLVLVPSAIGRSAQLDSINFGMSELAAEYSPQDLPPATARSSSEDFAHPPQVKRTKPAANRLRGAQLIIRPLIGKPHPKSSGERLLWESLEADPELAGLFRCNQPTKTKCDTTHLVDFVYGIGKLVVEVDGYHWHKSQYKFAHDRHRDYELHLSGYVVLRLPHDEVIDNVSAAVEKIRRLVRMRATRADR